MWFGVFGLMVAGLGGFRILVGFGFVVVLNVVFCCIWYLMLVGA